MKDRYEDITQNSPQGDKEREESISLEAEHKGLTYTKLKFIKKRVERMGEIKYLKI